MSDYKAEKISCGLWRIVDSKQCCIYLIEGENCALAVDTGMSESSLLSFIKTLTDKPVELGALLLKVKRKNYQVNRYIPVADGEEIDLGGVKIKCIGAFGHTPGSMLLIDETHKAVICGDAVGSGSGVWMFLPDCISVNEYKQS